MKEGLEAAMSMGFKLEWKRAGRLWALAALLLISVSGCACGGRSNAARPAAAPADFGKEPTMNWETRVKELLPLYGHRNWIVIADSAYPAQTAPGIEVVYAGGDQAEVLRKVFEFVDRASHVQPIIHLDKELDWVGEDLAPGVEAYRQKLETLLRGRRVEPMLHEELIKRLDEAAQLFRILVIKTDMTLPYTSVFLELDCGYWGSEKEKTLRERMTASGSASAK